jgi:hypothetical protein
MGYNERNPIFSFRLGEYRHGKMLRLSKLNKMPANDFLRKIIDEYLAGDLIPKAKDDLAVEMQKLKGEKLKAEIKYMELKIKYLETFGAPMSNSATRILKPQVITTNQQTSELKSPYDEINNRIQCVECGGLYHWKTRDEFLQQKYEFELHLTNKHNRPLSYSEKSVLDDLTYHGASK